ncbi:MAG: hypothetical protein ACD_15C00137G0023 [uncultured bacterium]|nr:MAG: hypothetical protein ACD_15C00137G0023 [uncultured bacterium]
MKRKYILIKLKLRKWVVDLVKLSPLFVLKVSLSLI